MNCIFTISTYSHLYKTYALRDSIAPYGYELKILLIDSPDKKAELDENTVLLSSILENDFKAIYKLYRNKSDKLRWALKSVFAKHLLNNGYEKLIYIDNDIFFYSSPDFIFEKLTTSNFLLTPHFYKSDPESEQNWLEANFRLGLYNAGFFAANKEAIPILDWWIKCCLYEVKISFWRGLYVDQKYLDLFPILFDKVEVLKHRGCNFSGWNCEDVNLKVKNKQLYINNDELTFIHFSPIAVKKFSNPSSLVYPSYESYLSALRVHKKDATIQPKMFTRLNISTYFYYLKWKLARLFK